MKMIAVFDIDGTLANVEHRLHHIRQKPKDWAKFEAEIVNDTPILPTIALLRSLHFNGWTILLATGRNEKSRYQTGKQMMDWHIPFDKLYMRDRNDRRRDTIVKGEMFDKIVVEYGTPAMVFEDRNSVVDMWRQKGVWVFDCNQTREDF